MQTFNIKGTVPPDFLESLGLNEKVRTDIAIICFIISNISEIPDISVMDLQIWHRVPYPIAYNTLPHWKNAEKSQEIILQIVG